MKSQRAYKFRLYPDRAQETLFHKTFGCCRFLYNHMLADKKEMYEKTGKTQRLTPARYKKEYPWLREVDSLALANVQLHLEAAYKKFFAEKKAGFPKFKSVLCREEGRVPEVQIEAQEPEELHDERGEREYPPCGRMSAPAQSGRGKDPVPQGDPGRIRT